MDIRISDELAGRTIKSILFNTIKLSGSCIRSLKFSGKILLNGVHVHTDHCVESDDSLTLRFPEKHTRLPAPSKRSLHVPYEDDDYLILDKPAPLPSVPSVHQLGETLENLVFTHMGAPDDFVYRPVNRLDKGTSGLMVVAKSAHAQHRLQKLLHTESFIREYMAIVVGAPPQSDGIIDIGISKARGIKRCANLHGLPAQTTYKVTQSLNGYSLLRLRLLTGRTHQIRVHMQYIGCPVVGDFLYGHEHPLLFGRFALHSCYLSFQHPFSKRWVTCVSPIPEQFSRIMSSSTQENVEGNRCIYESRRNEASL